jgi:hypothetical protein
MIWNAVLWLGYFNRPRHGHRFQGRQDIVGQAEDEFEDEDD